LQIFQIPYPTCKKHIISRLIKPSICVAIDFNSRWHIPLLALADMIRINVICQINILAPFAIIKPAFGVNNGETLIFSRDNLNQRCQPSSLEIANASYQVAFIYQISSFGF